jgi:hypothetical protein
MSEKKVTIELAWDDAKYLHEMLDQILRYGVYPNVMHRLPTLNRLKAAIEAAEPARRIL